MYKLKIGDLLLTQEDLNDKEVVIFNGERYYHVPNSLKMILEPFIDAADSFTLLRDDTPAVYHLVAVTLLYYKDVVIQMMILLQELCTMILRVKN